MTPFARSACALFVVAGVAGPALAGGDPYAPGGIRDYRMVVPVPAPAPVPELAPRWYFRADVGIGFAPEPSVSERGLLYGEDSVTGPFGTSPVWFNKDFETFVTWGVGVGHYWSDRWRSDITVDVQSQSQVKINGSYSYDPVGAPDRVDGSTFDRTIHRSGTMLFNTYYDFRNDRGFTPYLGGGIGFAVHELDRNHTTNEVASNGGVFVSERGWSSGDKENEVSLAAMGTAGVAFEISDMAKIDLNYRYVYIGGVTANLGVNGNASRVDIGDIHEHQLRAGIRWDIN